MLYIFQKEYRKSLILFIAFVIVIGFFSHHKAMSGSSDFDTYFQAAHDIINHEDIYRRDTNLGPYLYLPIFACFFVFIKLFPYQVGHLIWFSANIIMFLYTIQILMKHFKVNPTLIENWKNNLVWSFLMTSVCLVMLADNLVMDQSNIFIIFCITYGYDLWQKNKKVAAGIMMSLGASVKIYPYLLFLYFVFKKDWKIIFGWLLGVILWIVFIPSILVGPNQNTDYLMKWKERVIDAQVVRYDKTLEDAQRKHNRIYNLLNSKNQVLDAVLYRLMLNGLEERAYDEKKPVYPAREYKIYFPLKYDESTVLKISIVMKSALFFITILLIFASRVRNIPHTLIFSLFICLALMLSSNARSHTLVLMIFPLWVFSQWMANTQNSSLKRILQVLGVLALFCYLSLGLTIFRAHGSGFFFVFLIWLALVLSSISNIKDQKSNIQIKN